MLTAKEFKAMSVGYERLCKSFNAVGLRSPSIEDLERESAFSLLMEMCLNEIFATHSPLPAEVPPVKDSDAFKSWNLSTRRKYKEEEVK